MLPLNSMLQMKKNQIEAYCKEAKIKLPKGMNNAVSLINAILLHQGQADQLISIPKGMTLSAAAAAVAVYSRTVFNRLSSRLGM